MAAVCCVAVAVDFVTLVVVAVAPAPPNMMRERGASKITWPDDCRTDGGG